MIKQTREFPFNYRGETLQSIVSGYFCLACGEGLPGKIEGQRLSDRLAAFRRRVDASIGASPALPETTEEWTQILQHDDGEAARSHLAAGLPIYVSGDTEFPGKLIRINASGTRDLVHFDDDFQEIVDRRNV